MNSLTTVGGTVVVDDIHVNDAKVGSESPNPVLWRLPRDASRRPPLPLSPRSFSVRRGNGYDNDEGGPVSSPRAGRPVPLSSSTTAATTTIAPPQIPRPSVGRRLRSAPSARANKDDHDEGEDDDGHRRGLGRLHLRLRHRSEGGDGRTTTRMEQTSTRPPPSSSSPSFSRGDETTAHRPSVLAALRAVSSIEPYATSPYFRRIFASGMRNLEERRQADIDVDDVEGALRSCFGINEDMVRVIADTAAAVVASMEGGLPPGGARGFDGSTTTMTTTRHGRGEGGRAATKPTAIRGTSASSTSSISADDDDRRRRIRDRLLSPVDLSGYSRRRGDDGGGGRHNDDDDDDDNTPSSPRTTTRTTPVESSSSPHVAARHRSEFFASVTRGRGRIDETEAVGRLLLPSFSGPDDEIDDNDNEVEHGQVEDQALRSASRANDLFVRTKEMATIGGGLVDIEGLIEATERSVGLKSLGDYKRLVEERTVELKGLERRYEMELGAAGRELRDKDEQLTRYRDMVEECERAIAAFEESIRILEDASNEKDALIAQLTGRVHELEAELERILAAKSDMELEYRMTVEALKKSIVGMEIAAGERDVSHTEEHAEMMRLKAELARVTEQYDTSRADLANARSVIAINEERLQYSEQEVIRLQGHIELYKNDISLSMGNATTLIDSLTNQKDSVIESLNAKVTVLEQSLAELEEEKEVGALTNDMKNKELNDKIHTLAIALTEKDRQILVLQKEQRLQPMLHRQSEEKKKHHHHRKIMISPEGYSKPQKGRTHEQSTLGAYHRDETRDDVYGVSRRRRVAPVIYYATSADDDSIFDP